MPEEIWRVKTKLGGAFRLPENSRVESLPPLEGLRSVLLTPDWNDEGKWSGLHKLGADVAIKHDANIAPPDPEIYQRVRDLVHDLVAVIAMGSGRRVWVSQSINAFSIDPDETGARRMIIGPGPERLDLSDEDVAPFPAHLLGARYDHQLLRVVRWWARAQATDDAVDKLIALNNAVDMLAASIKGLPGQTRICRKCGAKTPLKASQKERILDFLMRVASYDEATARETYRIRVDLAHGRAALGYDETTRMYELALDLSDAIREEVGRRLGVELPRIDRGLVMFPEGLLMVGSTQELAPRRLIDDAWF